MKPVITPYASFLFHGMCFVIKKVHTKNNDKTPQYNNGPPLVICSVSIVPAKLLLKKLETSNNLVKFFKILKSILLLPSCIEYNAGIATAADNIPPRIELPA